jgi:hypothetical protein
MTKHIGFRIASGLVLLAAIAGIAFFAFNAGMARGAAINIQAPAAPQTDGQPIPAVPYYGYGMPYFWRPFPFFGFGCFGVLIPLFLLFLAFGAARRMIWGPRWGWRHMHHGPWGDKGPGDPDFVPPMFAEWHKRAHEAGEKPAGDTEQK